MRNEHKFQVKQIISNSAVCCHSPTILISISSSMLLPYAEFKVSIGPSAFSFKVAINLSSTNIVEYYSIPKLLLLANGGPNHHIHKNLHHMKSKTLTTFLMRKKNQFNAQSTHPIQKKLF